MIPWEVAGPVIGVIAMIAVAFVVPKLFKDDAEQAKKPCKFCDDNHSDEECWTRLPPGTN